MTPSSDRDAAAELAERIREPIVDPSKETKPEAAAAISRRAIADALMSEAPLRSNVPRT